MTSQFPAGRCIVTRRASKTDLCRSCGLSARPVNLHSPGFLSRLDACFARAGTREGERDYRRLSHNGR